MISFAPISSIVTPSWLGFKAIYFGFFVAINIQKNRLISDRGSRIEDSSNGLNISTTATKNLPFVGSIERNSQPDFLSFLKYFAIDIKGIGIV
jgi:hypothetical protein